MASDQLAGQVSAKTQATLSDGLAGTNQERADDQTVEARDLESIQSRDHQGEMKG